MKVIDDMKKTIKKKKAFTLVELMGVLVIIGVLSAILIPVISNVLKENKINTYNHQLDSMKLAAKNLTSDNVFLLPTSDGESINITLGQLKSLGYMDKKIVNPHTKMEFSDCTIIEIKRTGNNYDYIINDSSFESDNCNKENSKVSISEPSNNFIAKSQSSSYIIVVNSNDDELFTKYNLDNSKIELVGAVDDSTKYSVNGENGIYKITLLGGETEGNLAFKLNSGAITDENGNDIIEKPLLSSEVFVDYTVPSIVIENPNYGAGWKNASSTADYILNLSSDESGSGVDSWSYSYDKKIWNEYSESYEKTSYITTPFIEDRNQLVYIRVCDKAGNCNDTGSSMIKIDKTPPTLSYELRKENSNGELIENDTWSNFTVYRKLFPSDECSNVKLVEYNNSGTWYEEKNIEDAYFETEGINNADYRVTDNAGNTTTINIKIKVDKTAPELTCSWNTYAVGLNVFSLTCTGSDDLSGGIKRRKAYCYNSTNGASYTCQYNSLDNRWNDSSFENLEIQGGYTDYIGFNIVLGDSVSSMPIKVQYRDTAGNTTCIMTGTKTASGGTFTNC